MIRNQASQAIGAQIVSASTGAAFAGVVTVYVTGDAGTQAIGSVGSGICTLEGNGYYTYRPSAAETNYTLVAFTFVGSGAVPVTVQITTVTEAQQTAVTSATGVSATPFTTLRRKVRERLNEVYALTTPGSPLVAPQGTTGATTITYNIVAINSVGSSDVSQGTTVTTANATLTGSNYNRLNWQAVPGATGYDVYRSATNGVSPVTLGKIGSTANTTMDDTGLAGDGSIAPTINTSGLTNPFWTEQELLDILILGAKDLWRAIIDLHQGHFTTVAPDNTLSYPAGASGVTTSFTGVPNDCFRILMIEPQNLTDSGTSQRWTYFKPKQFQSAQFQAARATTIQDAGQSMVVYYDLMNAGSPVSAPTIVGAPPVSSAIACRLVYVHTLPTFTESDNNPIPGESDNALISWGVAWARAKERDDRSPDPAWIATYATDKQSLLTALTPRQEQEEEVVEGLFDGMYEDF